MDLQAVQQGLATAAGAITSLRTYASLPDSINPPVFAPMEVEEDYNQVFGGGIEAPTIVCGLFVSAGDGPTGRAALAAYLPRSGATSVKAALEADKTLGGAAKTLSVDRYRGAYRLYNIASIDYLGVMFDVRVWA